MFQRETDLWRQIAAVAGGKLVKGLGADVAASERLGGDHPVEGGEGLLHGGADGGWIITHLEKHRDKMCSQVTISQTRVCT